MKYIHLVIFFGLLLHLSATAQRQPLKWDSKTVDHGLVSEWNNSPATFSFTNESDKPSKFLPLFYQREWYVKTPEDAIPPGGKGEVTVYYYTSETGSFSEKVRLYVNISDEPIYLTVKGNIQSIYANALTACPTFGSKVPEPKVVEHTIKVIDKNTREPIPSAMVSVKKGYRSQFRGFTNRNGVVTGEMKEGEYNLEAQKDRYADVESEIYVGRTSTTIIIEMERKLPPVIAQEDPPEPQPEPEPEITYTEPTITSNVNEQFEEPPAEEDVEEMVESKLEVNETIEPEDDGLLSRKLYSANNVVFLIDVSGSMRKDDKMEMLKTSMKKLVTVLREIDKVTVITYSTYSEVLLPTTTADNKPEIVTMIDSLTPGGLTNGVAGLNEAYDNVERNFLNGGNNQIIIATDGKFNRNNSPSGDISDMIKEKSDKGIKLSVVGFGQSRSAERLMKQMARAGDGNYMQILPGQENVEVLVEEIKANSMVRK